MGCLLSLLVISCGSTPPPPEEAPPPAPAQPAPPPPPPQPVEPSGPDQALLDSLDAALARAEAARKLVIDFDGPVFFEQESADAEDQYQSAVTEAKTDTPEDIEEAIASYTQSAEAFEKIFEDTLPLYAQARWDEITEARDEAIDLGIIELAYDRFVIAASTVEAALGLYEEGDYYAADDTARQAADRFKVLALMVKAYRTRGEIEFYSIGDYDPENSRIAGELFDTAVSAYDDGDLGAALNAAEETLLRYNLVLKAGMKPFALERKAAAEEERRFAEGLKADKAVKNDFATAVDVFDMAEVSFREEHYLEASKLYFQSEFAFAAATAAVEEKRLKAEEALRLAAEKVAASEVTARNAEVILEGSAQ
jgi:hypothetical protein